MPLPINLKMIPGIYSSMLTLFEGPQLDRTICARSLWLCVLGILVSTIRKWKWSWVCWRYGNLSKELKFASWGQTLVEVFGSSQIRLGKDAKGTYFQSIFRLPLQIPQKWLPLNNLPGDGFVFNLWLKPKKSTKHTVNFLLRNLRC